MTLNTVLSDLNSRKTTFFVALGGCRDIYVPAIF